MIPIPHALRSPSFFRVCAVTFLCTLMLASPAFAKKKKPAKKAEKAKPAAGFVVEMVPFSGFTASKADELKEAVELELNLAEGTTVSADADVNAAFDNGMKAAAIAKAMGGAKADIAVFVQKRTDGVLFLAFSTDGKPHFVKLLGENAATTSLAATAAELRGRFPTWKKSKALSIPGGGTAVKGTPEGKPDEDKVAGEKPRDPLDAGEKGGIGDSDNTQAPEEGAAKAGDAFSVSHTAAVSLSFRATTWRYSFSGVNQETQVLGTQVFPGATLRADVWFLDFLGLDLMAAGGRVAFKINSDPNVVITPAEFTSNQAEGAAALRGRYLLRLSEDGLVPAIGLGLRVGARAWRTFQTPVQLLSTGETLTVVPGFIYYGLTVGPEFYVPVDLFDRRLEIELKLEGMPLTRYSESPDQPGAEVSAFGWGGELLLRMQVVAGLFVELSGFSAGTYASFDGVGNRVGIKDSAFVIFSGGQVLNFNAGGTVGLGYFF
jgi:hypothetical protein